MNKKLYRKDIDGLRGIAVIAVLLFHLNNSFLRGGFIGVDVFFVISGFLITGILIKELKRGDFNFAKFYLRRIRRIFPMLFTVLAVSTAFAALMMLNEDLLWFAKTLKYSALQISNLLFIKNVGYFDPKLEAMPLLHTWSLGVEEQFYIIWPLLLFFAFRSKNKNIAFYSIVALSVASLVYSQLFIHINQKIAFFSPLSRLWELGVGSILAFGKIKCSNKKVNETLAFGGVLILIYSFVFISNINFPGIKAVLPCLGAGLIIFASAQGNFTYKILANKPLVFVGLISYSLYLWHWPIITFYKYYNAGAELTNSEAVIISAISFALSCFTWKYIENPFRKKTFAAEAKLLFLGLKTQGNKFVIKPFKIYRLFIIAFLICAAFIGLTVNIKLEKGWAWRAHNSYEDKNYSDTSDEDVNECRQDNGRIFKYTADKISHCVIGPDKTNFQVLVIGDSIASAYSTGIIDWAKKKDLSVLRITGGGCYIAPSVDIRRTYADGTVREDYKHCINYNSEILRVLKTYPSIKYIFIAANWSREATIGPGNKDYILVDSTHKGFKTDVTINSFMFKDQLEKFINIAGENRKVYLMGQIPSFYPDPFECLKKQQKVFLYKNGCKTVIPLHEHREYVDYQKAVMIELANRHKNVIFFNPEPYFCDDKSCYTHKNGQLLYHDPIHLNMYGGHYIGQFFSF